MKIIDTDVISRQRKKIDPRLGDWLARHDSKDLAVAAPTIAEIRYGQARLSIDDPRAPALDRWLQDLRATWIILPMDDTAADCWGRMLATPALRNLYFMHPNQKRPSFGADLMIAAIALINNAAVVTGNSTDFHQIAACFPALQVENPFMPSL